MRKFLLLAGTATTLIAAPAAACDLEALFGGAHRYNPLAGMYGGGAPVASSDTASTGTESTESVPAAEPETTASTDTGSAPPESTPADDDAPAPSATFR